jgi:hypothetical protein
MSRELLSPVKSTWHARSVMQGLAMTALASTVVSGSMRLLPRGSNVFDLLDQRPVAQGAGGPAIADENEFARVVRPNRRKLLAGALGAYALINFVVCLSILQGGQPVQRGARPCLNRTAR